MRNGGDEALANASEGEGEKDEAGEKDGAECRLPRDAHSEDDGVGEVGVETHAGREGEGIVGERSHENAAEGRAETGGGCDGGERHAGFAEERRVHEDDVRHRDEGRKTCEDLCAPVSCVGGEAEVVLQASADGHQVRLP